MATLNLRKAVVLAYADYQLAEGIERANLYKKYLEEKQNLDEQMPFKATAQKILEVEKALESLIFWLQGQMGRKQGVSMTLDQLRCLTLYDLYSLKNRFKIEQPIQKVDTNDTDF